MVLGVLVADAQAAWLTRWAEVDGDCEDGWRRLDVACVEDDVVVDEGLCESEDRPDAFAACSARVVHVDAAAGDDANDGSAASPLATLGACIDKFGVDHSATKQAKNTTQMFSLSPVSRMYQSIAMPTTPRMSSQRQCEPAVVRAGEQTSHGGASLRWCEQASFDSQRLPPRELTP